ncbi:lysophospholipid acyltransferase family protein [Aureitalea marina]|uniref:1-acyl-sn-glycerol-3-phosphate acyltransferase n=1 Tax=Aureitalea marina TaxID=930804 RepID=A0A2S7KSE7_9FLAO|nr:lysophospholipid acyltransferase family protein [Aureitalea marina]PQB05555.1 1-acyl-sn-glycerol-3-phosphate acyltransferase [Aureitalea marina]
MKSFSHLLSYPLTAIFYLLFGLLLLIFDPIQRICLNVFGYSTHKWSVDIFNLLILRCLHVLGTTYTMKWHEELPKNVPVIIVANHQSMWDIPPLIWFLRKIHPKFISKIELGKGIPTISYNLKYGGSVLIDRKNPQQATAEIHKMGRYIHDHKRSVVIFPEGTRSRDGKPKPFKRKGLKVLFQEAPEAMILPVSISNSWKLQRNGAFPIPVGSTLRFEFHPLIPVSSENEGELIERVENLIVKHIYQDQ